MKRIRLSIGSWAYCFGPYKDNPVPFDTVIDKLGELAFDGVELGGFPPHPHPAQFDTKAKRAAQRSACRPSASESFSRTLFLVGFFSLSASCR